MSKRTEGSETEERERQKVLVALKSVLPRNWCPDGVKLSIQKMESEKEWPSLKVEMVMFSATMLKNNHIVSPRGQYS